MRTRESLVNRQHTDVRQELLRLGATTETATLIIPFVWFRPATTDPYSPSIIMLVEAIQHRLRTIGFSVPSHGRIDQATDTALTQVAGPGWASKAWITVVGDVLNVHTRKVPAAHFQPMGLGDDDGLGFVPASAFTLTGKGSCKPTTGTAARDFKNLQRQTNRVLRGFGVGRSVAEDGVLGQKTVEAVRAAARAAGSRLKRSTRAAVEATAVATPECAALARVADELGNEFSIVATAAGAPSRVPSPTPKQQVVVDPTTGAASTRPTLAALIPFDVNLEDPKTLGAIAIGGALLVGALGKKKGR